jgi:disulfide bond formation protein DsbB
MSEAVTAALAVLALFAQVALAGCAVVALLRLAGATGPWRALRETLDGSELWLAFAVALVATAGSLFFSEVRDFVPCKLCWFQRIAMYPLVLLAVPAFLRDRRAAWTFLPLPVVGIGIALWHVLVERGVVEETRSCAVSAPGGCGVKWIEELGYVTIPTLAATAFALCLVLLALAATSRRAG